MRIKVDGPDVPDINRALLLSEGQKLCLRGVLAHMTSEQIAAEAGLSPRKVDSLIRSAVRDLGVASRTEAALLLAAIEGRFPTLSAPSPDRNAVQAPPRNGLQESTAAHIRSERVRHRIDADMDRTEEEQIWNDWYDPGVRRNEPPDHPQDPQSILSDPQNISTYSPNDLSKFQRILFILLVSLGSSIMLVSLVLAVAAMESLR